MHSCVVRLRVAAVIAMVLALAACGAGGPTGGERPLPSEFAVRSDVPYIRGTIAERTVSERGVIRLHVKAPPGADVRVSEALVTVLPDAVIRWEDGAHGTIDQLTRGRRVTVWVTGPELRSLPPQVTANGFILHSAF